MVLSLISGLDPGNKGVFFGVCMCVRGLDVSMVYPYNLRPMERVIKEEGSRSLRETRANLHQSARLLVITSGHLLSRWLQILM